MATLNVFAFENGIILNKNVTIINFAMVKLFLYLRQIVFRYDAVFTQLVI